MLSRQDVVTGKHNLFLIKILWIFAIVSYRMDIERIRGKSKWILRNI